MSGRSVEFVKVGAASWESALCDRVAALFGEGLRVYVRAPSRVDAMRLDDLLWTWREESFVPHGLWSGEEGFDDPVAVGWKAGNPNGAEVLVLGGDIPAEELLASAEGYTRAVDFIPEADPAATEAARGRYRTFRDAGYAPSLSEVSRKTGR